MPKYLVRATYTSEGAQGLIKDGGTKRRAAVDEAIRKLEGRLEAFYFAFGEDDVVAIAELPDHATSAAFSLAVAAAGAVRLTTTVLLTPEEIDAAARKTVNYRPPGQS